MANPELSRKAARLFNEYKAPLDLGFDWAMEIAAAENESDLSPELQAFLENPYYLQTPPEHIAKHLQGKHDQRSHAGSRATIEAPSFSDEEYDAISAYTGSATVQINHKLRGLSRIRGVQPAIGVWRMSDEKIDNVVKNLDTAIGKSKLIKRTVMEREIPATSLKTGLFGSAVGKTISDKGFLSLKSGTSDIPPLKGFVKLRITAPSGTTALDMSFINPNAMGEIIFPRDTKIKITSVSGGGANTIVRGEIVG